MNEKNINASKKLYQDSAAPLACAKCHGEDGDGNGVMAYMFEPAPRNFTCSEVVSGLPDGQFFWIIKNGSIGTSMPASSKLTDEQIWQLTLYLRSFEIKPEPVKNSQSNAKQIITRQAALYTLHISYPCHSDIDIFLLFVTIACLKLPQLPATNETRFILRT